MDGGSWLSKKTPEFVGIQHLMFLALSQTSTETSKKLTTKDLSIFQLNKKPSVPSSKLSLPCFLDFSTHSKQTLRKLCESDKPFADLDSSNYLHLRWGGLDFFPTPTHDPLTSPTPHLPPTSSSVILALVDAEVGRSQVLMKSKNSDPIDGATEILLPGFDSQYVVFKPDKNGDVDFPVSSSGPPCHRYIVYDGRKIDVKAIVRFTLVVQDGDVDDTDSNINVDSSSSSADNADKSDSADADADTDADAGPDPDADPDEVYDRVDYFDIGDAWAPMTLREKLQFDQNSINNSSSKKTKQQLVPVLDEFDHIYEESSTISQDPFIQATIGSIEVIEPSEAK